MAVRCEDVDVARVMVTQELTAHVLERRACIAG